MNAIQTETLLKTIIDDLGVAADYISVLDPQIIPFITIGKAVGKLVPGLAEAVQNWIEGNPPTEAELAEFKAKLATLSDPNLP